MRKENMYIEISKINGDYSIWNEKRIKNAFNNGHGTLKDFERYIKDNKIYVIIKPMEEAIK